MKLGHYELLGELGRGGMGVVYRAHDPLLRREVAIKVIQPQAADAEVMARFQREAQTASNLRHEGIVPVLAAGLERGRPYLVMDLVKGESLRDVLRREGALDQPRAARLVRDVARALEHAHARGVLHRDVKPENVLLEAGGRPRLTDFGLAALQGDVGRLTREGEAVGTPCYMAPEQAMGERGKVGPWSDVYGLGAMLYELLAGQPPFAGSSAMAALESTVHGRVTSPRQVRRDLDPELEQVVMKALAREPGARHGSAEELALALEAWLKRHDVPGVAPARRPRAVAGGAASAAPRGAGPAVALGALGTVGLVLAVVAAALWAQLGTEREARAAREADVARLERRVAELEARLAARDEAAERPLAPAPPEPAPPEAAPVEEPRRATAPQAVAADEELERLNVEVERLANRRAYAEALPLAERAAQLGPRQARALNNLGAVLQALGKQREALAWFDRAVAADPTHTASTSNRAYTRLALGDLRGAREDFDRALTLRRDDAELFRSRAVVRDRLGDSRGALDDFSRALDLEPRAPQVWCERGIVRGRLGDHRGAIDDYDRALALAPDDPRTLSNRGVARGELGDLAGSVADIERALTLGVDDPTTALGNLGAVFQLQGDHARAVEALTRALELDPTLAVVQANRGISRGKLGDHRGAIEDCARALERLAADSNKARQARAALAAAREALGQ